MLENICFINCGHYKILLFNFTIWEIHKNKLILGGGVNGNTGLNDTTSYMVLHVTVFHALYCNLC